MSRFVSQLQVEDVGPETWRLLQPFRYESDLLGREVIVPRGFLTNFASVPRWPFAWWLAGGVGDKASTIHDYLYAEGSVTRKMADDVFLEALELELRPVAPTANGAGWRGRLAGWRKRFAYRRKTAAAYVRRHAMHRAVRLFAGPAWREHRRENA